MQLARNAAVLRDADLHRAKPADVLDLVAANLALAVVCGAQSAAMQRLLQTTAGPALLKR